MALMPDPKLESLLTKLSVTFAPIYDAWRARQPATEGLKLPANCNECLARDIMAIGQIIIKLDRKAQKNEQNLLAEILAFFQKGGTFLPYETNLSTIDNQVNSAMSAASPLVNDTPQWPQLLTVDIVKGWVSENPSHIATGKQITAALSDLVNVFIIRDGMVDNKELALLSSFEKHVAV